jgi:quinol monooxygenase YgiN
MNKLRRSVVTALALAPLVHQAGLTQTLPTEKKPMYGIIGKFKAQPGKRDALAEVLIKGTGSMPGCISYIVAHDPKDPDALWITEVWDSAESHKASLALPEVKEAMTKGRPLIAGFGERFETAPIGGVGIPATR